MTTSTLARIGPYRIVRQLGAGGMGHVYLATSPSGRAVAVKVIRPELAGDPRFRLRFRAEVDAARAVSGAYTTPVVDADPDGQPPWLATAFVPGLSLQEAVETYGPLPEPTLRVLGAGIAEALLAVHRAGLIHRDLQPSNILLAADGPRVIDFGISRAFDATALTVEGELIGSAGYMSPEHIAGLELTPASDVFSFGAVMAYAATGRPAFGAGPFHVLMFRATHEPPRLDGVPPALAGLVAACLHKDPAQRPPATRLPEWLATAPGTSGWLPASLEHAVRERERLAVAKRPVRRRAILIGGGATVAAAALSGGAYLLFRSDTSPSVPQLTWTATLPSPGLYPSWASTNTTLVCTGRTGVAAFDPATGKALWNDAGAGDTSVSDVGTSIYAVRTDGKLHALDVTTGRERWASVVTAGDPPSPVAISSSGTLVVRDNQQRLYAVDAATGNSRWTHEPSAKIFEAAGVTAGGLLIRYEGGGGVAGHEEYQATGDINSHRLGSYHALRMDTGEMAWSKDGTPQGVYVHPTGDVFYAMDAQQNILALRASTGDPIWTSPSGFASRGMGGFYDAFRLHAGILICYPGTDTLASSSQGGMIGAFDAVTGRKLWSLETPHNAGWGWCGQTLCYVDTNFHAVDLLTGKALWTAGADLAPKLQLLGGAGDMIVAGTSDDANGQGGLYGWDAKTGRQVWHHPVATNGGSNAVWSAYRPDERFIASYSGTLFGFHLAGNAPTT
jgi:serine/threonine protein kinase